MKILPPEDQVNTSASDKKGSNPGPNYKGSLPSQKYFTPKELNNLANVGKRSDATKKIVKEELKKAN